MFKKGDKVRRVLLNNSINGIDIPSGTIGTVTECKSDAELCKVDYPDLGLMGVDSCIRYLDLVADAPSGGAKYDDGKARWDLLPLVALEEVVKVYTFGVKKYDDWNWYKGLSYSRCVAALWRHYKAWWWDKESIDPESNCHHLAACVFYVLALLSFELEVRQGLDDRPGGKYVSKADQTDTTT